MATSLQPRRSAVADEVGLVAQSVGLDIPTRRLVPLSAQAQERSASIASQLVRIRPVMTMGAL